MFPPARGTFPLAGGMFPLAGGMFPPAGGMFPPAGGSSPLEGGTFPLGRGEPQDQGFPPPAFFFASAGLPSILFTTGGSGAPAGWSA